MKPVFRCNEERILHDEPLTLEPLRLAISTGRYKIPAASLPKGDRQSARDASALINHKLRFYERAGVQPRPFNTIHWSITTNGVMTNLYINWSELRDGRRRYLTRQFEFANLQFVNRLPDVRLVNMRRYLRNILSEAVRRALSNLENVVLSRIRDRQKASVKPQ